MPAQCRQAVFAVVESSPYQSEQHATKSPKIDRGTACFLTLENSRFVWPMQLLISCCLLGVPQPLHYFQISAGKRCKYESCLTSVERATYLKQPALFLYRSRRQWVLLQRLAGNTGNQRCSGKAPPLSRHATVEDLPVW